jgi:hypothetical protein
MKAKSRIARTSCLFAIAIIATSLTFGQANHNPATLNFPVGGHTVVRFFYLPPNSYLHAALIFRVVGDHDPRLNTSPINNLGGRTPYITLAEMQNLIQQLSDLDLSWQQSKRVEVPKELTTKEMTDRLQIDIFFSQGTDRTLVDPQRLCATLATLDPAFRQPRALWEFQLFRVDYHCTVPGFNRNAYPEHDLGTR